MPPGRPAHAAATAGFSIQKGEIPRETDCLLEGDGFELPVPRAMQAWLEAKIAGFGCMFAVDYLRLPSVAIS
jgi:hypothetical protein